MTSDFETQTTAHNRRVRETHVAQKATLFDALASHGIVKVTVTFDGYGDEGQVDETVAEDANGPVAPPDVELTVPCAILGQVELDRKTVSVATLIEHLAYDFLSLRYGYWEDGEGAFGDFVFDVAARTIQLDFNARYVESTNSSHAC